MLATIMSSWAVSMGTESETVDDAYIIWISSRIGEIETITCHGVMSSNRKACRPPSSTWSHHVTQHVSVTLAYLGRASIRYGSLHSPWNLFCTNQLFCHEHHLFLCLGPLSVLPKSQAPASCLPSHGIPERIMPLTATLQMRGNKLLDPKTLTGSASIRSLATQDARATDW